MASQRFMVVLDPTQPTQPAFERALQSALMTGADLHLYTCTCRPPGLPEGQQDAGAMARFRSEVDAAMHALAERAAAVGVVARVEVGCAGDFRQEMVQAADRIHADLVFKYAELHSTVQREQRETADWLLLRLSPCPVVMVKDRRDWSARRVLGAVNLGSHDPAHIKLNHQVVAEAQRFAEDFGAEAHFVTAYADQNRSPDRHDFARLCGVDIARAHTRHGAAALVIRDVAEAIGADLVLIGTVARGGLMGTVVGNTAERVLDESLADVMVLN